MADAADYPLELGYIAGAMRRKIGWPGEAGILVEAANHIKTLTADNGRLAAEVERLKRKMTRDEAIEILNSHEYQGFTQWENTHLLGGEAVEFELFAVAHWLEITKGAGPIPPPIEKEAVRG
ncbi:MAG: hypothetical protein P4L67_04275 [Candidatus Pacebacteria bacterium]|nr:hypothetical protein [Candidatus Paceibacterota bacterium]